MENQPKTYNEMEIERKRQEKLKDCFLTEIRRKQVYILNLLVIEQVEGMQEIMDNLIEGLATTEKIYDYAFNIPAFCFVEPDKEFLELYSELQNIYTKEKARLGVK